MSITSRRNQINDYSQPPEELSTDKSVGRDGGNGIRGDGSKSIWHGGFEIRGFQLFQGIAELFPPTESHKIRAAFVLRGHFRHGSDFTRQRAVPEFPDPDLVADIYRQLCRRLSENISTSSSSEDRPQATSED